MRRGKRREARLTPPCEAAAPQTIRSTRALRRRAPRRGLSSPRITPCSDRTRVSTSIWDGLSRDSARTLQFGFAGLREVGLGSLMLRVHGHRRCRVETSALVSLRSDPVGETLQPSPHFAPPTSSAYRCAVERDAQPPLNGPVGGCSATVALYRIGGHGGYRNSVTRISGTRVRKPMLHQDPLRPV